MTGSSISTYMSFLLCELSQLDAFATRSCVAGCLPCKRTDMPGNSQTQSWQARKAYEHSDMQLWPYLPFAYTDRACVCLSARRS